MTVNTHYNKLEIKRDLVSEVTAVKSIHTLGEIEEAFSSVLEKEGTVVIWLMNRIIWTRFENGHIKLDEDASEVDFWQEVRGFNGTGEVHLVRMGDALSGRSVIDKDASGSWKEGYVDTIAPLWGDNAGFVDGVVHLIDEDRKLKLDIPCTDGSAANYGLVTRSYIKADDTTGLSGYVDYRYLAVEGMEA
ncbi:CRISPR-associated protein Csx19 [Anaerovibrio sp. RM50]|uniref:type III-D CRISPR-associated protein Csx19 n=1 Tax=Anaerovibrio sp. RM50 TaxID=1200557 RepID=UPI0004846CFC|nr:CRISPR-associated protein Csx19 [Anaerovibrio sp. RM50]